MYYEIHGDASHSEAVLLSSGLGGSHQYWQAQVPELAKRFKVVIYDQYGTGKSAGVLPHGYKIADMAAEIETVMAQSRTERAHIIGHALGGLIGLQLALQSPEKVASLLLINAWDKTDEHTKRCFDIRKSILKQAGLEVYLKAQPLFLYPSEWMKSNRALLDRELDHLLSSGFSEDNLLARIAAIEAFDVSQFLSELACPVGLVASKDDLLVPYSCSLELDKKLTQSSLYVLEHGGHGCNVTEPEAFNHILETFYDALR